MILFVGFLLLGLATPVKASSKTEVSIVGKVITAYVDRNTTKFVVQVSSPLISGQNVYAGAYPLTVGGLLSRSDGTYYYEASTPGRPKIRSGEFIASDRPQSRELSIPAVLTLKVREHYTFERKHLGEITAVQGKRALMDRGSLHEVRERDLYKVVDGDGRYRGLLEIRGVGDFQSSGVVYNRIEDVRKRSSLTQPGDRLVFLGQRKLFALGIMGGIRSRNEAVLNHTENSLAGGLLWGITFPDGWGLEVCFGAFIRDGKGDAVISGTPTRFQHTEHRAQFIAPMWLKKSLFYPAVVSPFLAAGLAGLNAENEYHQFGNGVDIRQVKKVSTVVPVLGGGLELFPGRFFRPRIEVRYFDAPRITAHTDVFTPKSLFYGAGFLTTW